MAKTIWDYPMGFGYGATDGYWYGPNGKLGPYHRGDDWFAPVGTPVVVNGVEIGRSGKSGSVDGPHTHVGKWQNGKDYNPNLQGATLGSDAVVTEIDRVDNSANGKFVRVRSQGFDWLYLHMDSIKDNLRVGDKLQGGDMPSKVDIERVNELFVAYWTRPQIEAEAQKAGKTVDQWLQGWVGTESNSLIKSLAESPQYRNKRLDAENELATLRKQLKDCQAGGTVLAPGKYLVI